MANDKSKRQQTEDQAYDEAELDQYDNSNMGSAGGQAGDVGSDMEDAYDSRDFYAEDDKVS